MTSRTNDKTPKTLSDDALDQASGGLLPAAPAKLAARRQTDGAKGGNVEFEWKVEEGES